ncbi:MAG: family 20 glycosylhydrolase, partial [Parafilimonas sp.]
MKQSIFCVLLIFFFFKNIHAQQSSLDSLLTVRGFCISAPSVKDVDRFVKFIDEELAPRKVNTLILRVDYNYQYKSHPELADSNALSKNDVDKIVAVCKKDNINLIPQVNLLGHQSWDNKTDKLLSVYPQFDETPNVKMPAHYEWPNADNLYCKSYCPLYPGIHKIIFDIVDEICDAFQSTAFHAGMDEVFYIGEAQCPRCGGKDKAELFANEVRLIDEHLAAKKRSLWIWGDRLIDGKTTGIGEWEASYNNTYRAIDMIPKDVIICDWHYERADKTPVYFAMKGLNVITCTWNQPAIALMQTDDMINFKKTASEEMQPHFYGMMQTVWIGAGSFLNGSYS